MNSTIPTAERPIHPAPTTPGWQLLLGSAQAVTSEAYTLGDLELFRANLLVRRSEHIPAKHLPEVTHAVCAAVCSICKLDWIDEPVLFLHAQLGKEGVRALIEGSGYEIRECHCEEEGSIGYHIGRSDPARQQILDEKRERELREARELAPLLRAIFSQG